MKPDQYPTTHAIARQLLAMDDMIAILPMPVFDMPGGMQALPVSAEEVEIEGRKCVAFRPLREDSANVRDQGSAPTTNSAEERNLSNE
jgi:hypothetical protein